MSQPRRQSLAGRASSRPPKGPRQWANSQVATWAMPIVYILTNPVMPDLIKIGRTDGPIEDRVRQLSAVPGVPVPFEVFFAAEVEDSIGWERALHEAFDDRRVNPRREFFRLSPDKPFAILKMAHLRNVTPHHDIVDSKEELDALDRERRRGANFSFAGMPIQTGAILQSVFDEGIECQVVDDRSVLFRGTVTSLSRSALEIAHEKGHGWTTIRGPAYWKYEGRTLVELREAGTEPEVWDPYFAPRPQDDGHASTKP